MGRQGPCHHCGITYSSIWRSGPKEKPVLCNACGARWKTKGSLRNYTPRHAQYYKCGQSPSSARSSSLPTIDEVLSKVTRQPRSVRGRPLVSEPPTRGFLQELQDILLKEPEFSSELQRREEEGVLISEHVNHYIHEDEVGDGCMLLKPQKSSP